MKRLFFLIFLYLIFSLRLNFISAHMCHDPFRPQDNLVLVPDSELVKIERSGEFRIYVENTFSSTLQEVKLCIESPAFNIEVEPSVIEKLVPGERSFFLVRLNLRDGFPSGDYPLKIDVEAKSAEVKPSIEAIEVVVEEPLTQPSQQVRDTPGVAEVEELKQAKEVVVRVEDFVLAQRFYLYLVPIVLLIGFLVWRKFR